jgi:Bacterial protein of unknown function (DUF937)
MSMAQGPSRLVLTVIKNLTQTSRREEKAMATNLVTLIMQFLTPDMIGRIANTLGVGRSDTATAVDAAVPALLAALTGVATQPGGPQKLANAAKQETGVLDRFGSMLGGGGQTSFVDRGSQMLSSLLGDRDQSALANAVGKYSGLQTGPSSSLLGALAPVVMGTIAQQQGGRVDAGSIANLLTNQKDNIAAALPSGLSRLLGGTDLLEPLGDTVRRTTAAGGEAARAAAAAVARTADDTRRSAQAAVPSTNWLMWAILALAIAALLFYLLARPGEQVVQQGVTTEQNIIVGGLNLNQQVTDSIGSLRTTLNGITNAASAQAALPRLQQATAQLDKVSGVLGQLSTGQRTVLAGLINPVMPALNQLIDRVLVIPGVAEIIKPTIDTLKARLAVLAAA